jgi:hypothetical protein
MSPNWLDFRPAIVNIFYNTIDRGIRNNIIINMPNSIINIVVDNIQNLPLEM